MIYVATGRLSWVALGLVLSLGTGCPSDDTTDGVANKPGSGTADEFGTDRICRNRLDPTVLLPQESAVVNA